jgi:RNA polymerase sigma factor (sigma-70 family)
MAGSPSDQVLRHVHRLFQIGAVGTMSDAQLLDQIVSRRDEAAEAAFEELVIRHGPMVLRVCRSVLHNAHDAEDAFQAAFLVLADRARSIRRSGSVASWLFGVARRVATRARRSAARWHALNQLVAERTSESYLPAENDPDWEILHEEINGLPERLRAPIVLCYLQGLTYAAAARQLGLSEMGIRGRLARARERLRQRLTRRGVTAPAGLLVAGAAGHAQVAIPRTLIHSTSRIALGFLAGNTAAILARGVLNAMLLGQLRVATVLFCLGVGGSYWAWHAFASVVDGKGQANPDPPGSPAALQADQKPDPKAGVESGATVRVLDPDGKPAAGAAVYRFDTSFHSLAHEPEPRTPVLLTQTGSDGSFRLSPADTKAALDRSAQFVITAEGCGPAFVDPSVGDGMKVLRLAKDDVPIRGRVIDIQGRPVASATVQLVGILWHPFGNLDEWLNALKTEKAAFPVAYGMLRWWSSDDHPSLSPAIITDREGRFTLKGVGRERIASLLIGGPGVETRLEYVATRDMPAVKVSDHERRYRGRDMTYHGAAFDLVAGPGLEIVGTVRDKDTGKPLTGVTVQTTAPFGLSLRFLKTTTDAEGHYRLSRVPRRTSYGAGQDVLATLKEGPPYVPSVQHVGDGREPGPIRKDFALKRGVLARGRVTDKSTGKPIMANLDYFILADNPHLKDYPGYGTVAVGMPFYADENGEYKIAVIPGRGIVGARFGNATYRVGVGMDKIKGLKTGPFGMVHTRPYSLTPGNYNTLVAIDPKAGDESVTADIELDCGRTLKGKLVGPDREPVAGALMLGAEDRFQVWSLQPLPTAEFEVHALGSRDKRGLLFYHEAKQLAGAYVLKPDEEGPVTVRLEPCGTLTGRLVDDGGLPWAGAQMTCERPYDDQDSRFQKGALPTPIKTDKDGRFRVSGLVPGLKYSLALWKGSRIVGEAAKDVIIKAGETRDLREIKVSE